MPSDRPGRPRVGEVRRPGGTARDEILDAAAELFTTGGYASTSTRRIAEAVGVRQASLYHYFATKDDILEALLTDTVDAPLRLADELLAETGRYAPRLHALVVADAAQLCHHRWNLGALYLLPELRVPRFAGFRDRRRLLRGHYMQLSRGAIAEAGGPADAEDIPFRLVESVINRRSDDGDCPAAQPWVIGDAALRSVGFRGRYDALRTATAKRVAAALPAP